MINLRRILVHFLVAALFVNTIPHLVQGVTGQPFPTPFSWPDQSTPVVNVLWASANVAVAAMLLRWVPFAGLSQKDSAAAMAVGALLTAVGLALVFA